MEIILNGDPISVSIGTSIAQILEIYKIVAESVVVEWNGAIVRSDAYGGTCLNDGDRLEFIRFVGGG